MLKVSNVKVYDLVESVIASGNAMRIEPLEGNFVESGEEFKKGINRMIRLNKASEGTVNCHNHALCGIRVSFDVVYPQYWTPEFQRYNFADIVTSSSKMHRLCKMDIRKACNKYVSQNAVAELEYHVKRYNKLRDNADAMTFQYYDNERNEKIDIIGREESLYAAFMCMISNCPLGLELFMRVSTNYLQLRNIYFQRRDHKLHEDWGPFCRMIEELPYFNELILGNTES